MKILFSFFLAVTSVINAQANCTVWTNINVNSSNDIMQVIAKQLAKKGYTLTDNSYLAGYHLTFNLPCILYAGREPVLSLAWATAALQTRDGVEIWEDEGRAIGVEGHVKNLRATKRALRSLPYCPGVASAKSN